MKSIIKRYSENPILTPGNLQLSDSSIEIMCLLNPGVFVYKDRIGLLLRKSGGSTITEAWFCFDIDCRR